MWFNGVIPVAVEARMLDGNRGHLFFSDFDSSRIAAGVEGRFDAQAGARCRGADEAHDGLVAEERTTSPVLGDVTEEAVLDLVPLAGSGREMANVDRQLEFRGELRQFRFPGPHMGSIR